MHISTLLDDPRLDDPKTDTHRTAPPSASNVPDRNTRLIALLDSFDDGDPEQQRQDFDALQAGLNDARPGQRRLFGPGVNP